MASLVGRRQGCLCCCARSVSCMHTSRVLVPLGQLPHPHTVRLCLVAHVPAEANKRRAPCKQTVVLRLGEHRRGALGKVAREALVRRHLGAASHAPGDASAPRPRRHLVATCAHGGQRPERRRGAIPSDPMIISGTEDRHQRPQPRRAAVPASALFITVDAVAATTAVAAHRAGGDAPVMATRGLHAPASPPRRRQPSHVERLGAGVREKHVQSRGEFSTSPSLRRGSGRKPSG